VAVWRQRLGGRRACNVGPERGHSLSWLRAPCHGMQGSARRIRLAHFQNRCNSPTPVPQPLALCDKGDRLGSSSFQRWPQRGPLKVSALAGHDFARARISRRDRESLPRITGIGTTAKGPTVTRRRGRGVWWAGPARGASGPGRRAGPPQKSTCFGGWVFHLQR